ncbi:MAG: DUF4352 domain-containing protein [Candidatus Methanoperedens sp.]|nr:DUF4352 domain-containing protein [Candidatus Methanoperedens sp.]
MLVKMKLKNIGIIIIILVSVISLGCIESQPSSSISIENPKSTIVPAQAQSQENITVSYSAKKVNTIGQYGEAEPGNVFLVISMNIENHGYEKFHASPYIFNLIANNLTYGQSGSYQLDDVLAIVDIPDGGSINGSIAFNVPSNIGNYQLQYTGAGDYNIIYKVT